MTTAVIEFQQVTKVYRQRLRGVEVPVLTNASFSVGRGEVFELAAGGAEADDVVRAWDESFVRVGLCAGVLAAGRVVVQRTEFAERLAGRREAELAEKALTYPRGAIRQLYGVLCD